MNSVSNKGKRPRYMDRQHLRADDLSLEQHYQDNRLQQLTQHLLGWGVACGGFVTTEDEASTFSLSEGFAIAPLGQHLHIPALDGLDLLQLIKDGCGLSANEHDCEDIDGFDPETGEVLDKADLPERVYVVAEPYEHVHCSQPVFPEGCHHPGNHFVASRISDGVCIRIICELSELHRPEGNACSMMRQYYCRESNLALSEEILSQVFPCPPVVDADNNYVVLAQLNIGPSKYNPLLSPLVISGVRYGVRRNLANLQQIQRYLSCLCHQEPSTNTTPPNTPTSTPAATGTPTRIPTIVPTQTPVVTRVPTRIPTIPPTIAPSVPPTVVPTSTPIVTIMPTVSPPPSFTVPPTLPPYIEDPTLRPEPTGYHPLDLSDGALPIDSPVLQGVNVLEYDTKVGGARSIDEMILLSDSKKTLLHEAGINSLVDLYSTESGVLAETLGVSEVTVAEYKNNALASMRRAKAIELNADEFDVLQGISMQVEEVHNVGRVRGKILSSAGYNSVADVANAEAGTLAGLLDVSNETAAELIDDAKSRLRKF